MLKICFLCRRRPEITHEQYTAFVLEGQVSLTLGPEKHTLGVGDSVMILPKELRLWENPTPVHARVLIVSIRGSSAIEASRPEER